MITEHVCKGKKSTTYHNFSFTQSVMNINVSAGTYWNQGAELFTSDTGAIIAVEIPAVTTHYLIWLNDSGIIVLTRTDDTEFGEVTNSIDRLAWFVVPAGASTLDDVEIHVVKMTEVSA